MGQTRELPKGKRWPRWVTVTLILIGGLAPSAGGILVTAERWMQNGQSSVLGWATTLMVIGIISTGFSAYRQAMVTADKREPDVIFAALNVAHASFCTQFGVEYASIRFTLHVPYGRKKDRYCQVCPYTGGEGGGADRDWKVNCGIVGKAFRTKMVQIATRNGSDYASYLEELVSLWGYTKDEAESLKGDAHSWLAFPLPSDDGVLAVLYCDSTQSNFFTTDMMHAAGAIVLGIKRYLGHSQEEVVAALAKYTVKPKSDEGVQDSEFAEPAKGRPRLEKQEHSKKVK